MSSHRGVKEILERFCSFLDYVNNDAVSTLFVL